MRPRPTAPRLPDGVPRPRRRPWRSLTRAASWHRRKLAVVAAVATVLSGLAATASPGPPTMTVVRVRVALPGGSVLHTSDLETVALPRGSVPDEAVTQLGAVGGQRLAGPVSARQVITRPALLTARVLAGSGRVLAPVRIADADVVALLRPGEVIDVLATDTQSGKSATVAARARVVAVPVPAEEERAAEPGGLVVLEVDRSSVGTLTRALATSTLTVVWA